MNLSDQIIINYILQNQYYLFILQKLPKWKQTYEYEGIKVEWGSLMLEIHRERDWVDEVRSICQTRKR